MITNTNTYLQYKLPISFPTPGYSYYVIILLDYYSTITRPRSCIPFWLPSSLLGDIYLSSVAMATSGISGTENKDNKQRFVSLSKDKVQKLSIKFVPKNSKKNTNWAVKNFTGWRDNHNSNSEDQCQENLLEVANSVLINKWITRFMAETRHEDGSTYPPKTIA